jgi:hypothetical protein
MKLLLNLIALISISASMAQSPYEIIDAVSSDRIEQDIVKLVSFGTRHTMSCKRLSYKARDKVHQQICSNGWRYRQQGI